MNVFVGFVIVSLLVAKGNCSCPGCPEEVLVKEDGEWPETIKAAAEFAVEELGSDYQLDKIITAQTQVVAGTNYIMKLKVKVHDSPYMCEVKVYEHLPDKDTAHVIRELTESSCTNIKRHRFSMFHFSY